jgi:GntR family transcriptional regulator/MocR family aminotransferase
VVICAGFSHGLAILCEVLRQRGAAELAVEECGLAAHRDIVTGAGLRLVNLPVGDDGAQTAQLSGTSAGAALLTPAHQFPLGMPLAAKRRADAVAWAAATGGTVIEDDYDGEYRYDRQPLGAMQSLAPEHVVYAGTASKALAPGLRLGWLAVPASLMAEVVSTRTLTQRAPSTLDQLTLAEFINAGGYDRHVRRSRIAYRRRRDLLAAALREQVPSAAVSGVAAGLHMVVTLPTGQQETEAVASAARRGLAVQGLGPYSFQGSRPPALVVGYGTPPQHAFTGAVARLCAALADREATVPDQG